jgi:hypothetical protein
MLRYLDWSECRLECAYISLDVGLKMINEILFECLIVKLISDLSLIKLLMRMLTHCLLQP